MVAFLVVGFSGCGGSRQAVKEQGAVTPAGEKKAELPGAVKPGEQKKQVGTTDTKRDAKATAPAAILLKDIRFDFNRYLVKPEDAEILKQNSQWFSANAGKRVRIEGNCDERGTVEYNLALGQKRADAARNLLVTLGVDGKRIDTVSYGEEKPLDPGHGEEAWSKNRRDHFVPLP
jgi:peptidoglycan-associated lipoprotein